jgi:RNA polymerase sigma-70 factor, ECF subfamily
LNEHTCPPDEMLAKARAGDPMAFAGLVRLHERLVYSVALRMLGQRERAEDLAQDVFLQLHRKLAVIESPMHLTFWLRKVTTNRAIDRLRRDAPFEAVAIEEADGLEAAAGADALLERELGRRLLELAPAARAVMVLRYQEDLDPTQIATALDMSINTVKSHLKRSLATLRERMGAPFNGCAEEIAG